MRAAAMADVRSVSLPSAGSAGCCRAQGAACAHQGSSRQMRSLTGKEIAAVSGAASRRATTAAAAGRATRATTSRPGTAGEKGGKFTAGCHTLGGNGRAGASAAQRRPDEPAGSGGVLARRRCSGGLRRPQWFPPHGQENRANARSSARHTRITMGGSWLVAGAWGRCGGIRKRRLLTDNQASRVTRARTPCRHHDDGARFGAGVPLGR